MPRARVKARVKARAKANARARAFTLIEVLVVVAILSLLLTILLPSLNKARQLAWTMKCSTNLHAVGRASYLYAADHRNYVPRDFWYNPDAGVPGAGDFGHYFFAWCFSPYVGGPTMPRSYMTGDAQMYAVFRKMPVYRCPAVRDKTYVLTYVANGIDYAVYARSRTYTSSAVSRIDDLPASPSLIAYIWELDLSVPCDYFGVYDFFVPSQVTYWNGVPNVASRTVRFDDPRHAGRTTMSCFDGHAETRDLVASQFPNRLLNPLEK